MPTVLVTRAVGWARHSDAERRESRTEEGIRLWLKLGHEERTTPPPKLAHFAPHREAGVSSSFPLPAVSGLSFDSLSTSCLVFWVVLLLFRSRPVGPNGPLS